MNVLTIISTSVSILTLLLVIRLLIDLSRIKKDVDMVKEGIILSHDRLFNRIIGLYKALWLVSKKSVASKMHILLRSLVAVQKVKYKHPVLRFPLKADFLANAVYRSVYGEDTDRVLDSSRVPIEVDGYILCNKVSKPGERTVYALTYTGPIDKERFEEFKGKKSKCKSISLNNFTLTKTTDLYETNEESVIGYLVEKTKVNNQVTIKEDDPMNTFRMGLEYCSYLLELAKVTEDDDLYQEYTRLRDKNIIIPSKEDEKVLDHLTNRINENYKDVIVEALKNNVVLDKED